MSDTRENLLAIDPDTFTDLGKITTLLGKLIELCRAYPDDERLKEQKKRFLARSVFLSNGAAPKSRNPGWLSE